METFPRCHGGRRLTSVASFSRCSLIRRRLLLPFGDGLAEEEFDLAVDAAQFVRGPFLELLPEFGRDAEEERFAFGRGHFAQA